MNHVISPDVAAFHQIKATAREAGRNVVHTVTVRGETAIRGTRRSAHRYAYAIAYWTRREDGSQTLVITSWSRKPNATGSTFAIPVVSA